MQQVTVEFPDGSHFTTSGALAEQAAQDAEKAGLKVTRAPDDLDSRRGARPPYIQNAPEDAERQQPVMPPGSSDYSPGGYPPAQGPQRPAFYTPQRSLGDEVRTVLPKPGTGAPGPLPGFPFKPKLGAFAPLEQPTPGPDSAGQILGNEQAPDGAEPAPDAPAVLKPVSSAASSGRNYTMPVVGTDASGADALDTIKKAAMGAKASTIPNEAGPVDPTATPTPPPAENAPPTSTAEPTMVERVLNSLRFKGGSDEDILARRAAATGGDPNAMTPALPPAGGEDLGPALNYRLGARRDPTTGELTDRGRALADGAPRAPAPPVDPNVAQQPPTGGTPANAAPLVAPAPGAPTPGSLGTGALPPSAAEPAPAPAPQGAFAPPRPSPGNGPAPGSSAIRPAAIAAPQPAAGAAAAPGAPGKSAIDRYVEMLNGIKDKSDAMNKEDNKSRLLELGLNMMARGGTPGATGIGAIGQAGVDTLKSMRTDRKDNAAAEGKRVDQQIRLAKDIGDLTQKQEELATRHQERIDALTDRRQRDLETARYHQELGDLRRESVHRQATADQARMDANAAARAQREDQAADKLEKDLSAQSLLAPSLGGKPMTRKEIEDKVILAHPESTVAQGYARMHLLDQAKSDLQERAAKVQELVKQKAINPKTGQPFTPADAEADMAEAKKGYDAFTVGVVSRRGK